MPAWERWKGDDYGRYGDGNRRRHLRCRYCGISNVTVIINGGMVTATGFASPDMGGLPGIGSSNNCRVEINGGTVIASSALCAGIGGDSNPYYTGGTVTINGGKVTATSGFVGIGGANILVTVNGGTVTAIGSTNDLGGSKVIINGGSVNARAQSLVYNAVTTRNTW